MKDNNKETKEIIIGFLEKDGDYNGNHYSNYVLVTVTSVDGINRSCDCTSYKFKKSDCKSVTGKDNPSLCIGLAIKTANFDKFKRLTSIVYE